MNSILLSVICPIYNGQEYIYRLVSSLLHFNSNLIEVLLIDDGSTDDSTNICRKLSKKYPNVYFYKKGNGGIADARNFGINKSHGEYITFCDQDDEVLDSYSSFLNFAENHRCDILISNFVINTHKVIEPVNIIKEDTVYSREESLYFAKWMIGGKILEDGHHIPLIRSSIWNCLFRKKWLDENNIRLSAWTDYEDDWKLLIDVFMSKAIVGTICHSYYQWSYNQLSRSHNYKFIPYWFSKRKKFHAWVKIQLNRLNIDKQLSKKVMAIHELKTLQVGNVNYREKNLFDYCRNMNKQDIPICDIWQMLRIVSSFGEKILLCLIAFRLWPLVWIINKKDNHGRKAV